jgi:hypothetical protein
MLSLLEFCGQSIWPQIREGYITHNQQEMLVKHYNVKRMMLPTCVVRSLSFARAGTNDTIGDDRKPLCFTCPPTGMMDAVVGMSGLASPAMVPGGCPCFLRSKMESPLLAAATLTCCDQRWSHPCLLRRPLLAAIKDGVALACGGCQMLGLPVAGVLYPIETRAKVGNRAPRAKPAGERPQNEPEGLERASRSQASDQISGHALNIGSGSSREATCGRSAPNFFPTQGPPFF